jgi:hypothetical protein
MKKSLIIGLFLLIPLISHAQGPEGKDFGFGLILGQPLGGTIKYWTNPTNALVADIGSSYFGALRLQVDYLWHFNPFQSTIVKMYAGPGLALGFGAGHEVFFDRHGHEFVTTDNGTGVGIRAIFGLNVIPRRTPLEMFLEVGPLIGITPTGVGLDLGVGIRFYP